MSLSSTRGWLGANCRQTAEAGLGAFSSLRSYLPALPWACSLHHDSLAQAFQQIFNESTQKLALLRHWLLIIKTSYNFVDIFPQSLVTLDWTFYGWSWSLSITLKRVSHARFEVAQLCIQGAAESRVSYTHTLWGLWITNIQHCARHSASINGISLCGLGGQKLYNEENETFWVKCGLNADLF